MLGTLRQLRLSGLRASPIAAIIAFCYVVLIGGTLVSELVPEVRIVTATVGAGVVIYYVRLLPKFADKVDRLVVLSVVLFATAGLLSQYPRQSFDAVLSALSYAGALFLARRQLAREDTRRGFLVAIMVLSATLTITTAARWLPVVEVWWSTTGSIFPALDLDYPAVPWGHWHDLALLLTLLYPAWWIGKVGPFRAAAGTLIGVLALLLVFVDGSRNVWLALAIASLVVGLPRVVRRVGGRRAGILGAAILGVAALGAWITGLAAPLLERVDNLSNLGFRAAMWGAITNAWTAHPIAGLGPGSFPWILQRTSYFATNSYAPRHPDSLFFQLLGEAGILGILAAGCVAMALLPSVWHGRSDGAKWALIVFVVAGLAANPTDFAFLIVVAVGWAGYCAPNVAGPIARPVRMLPVRLAGASAALVLAVIGLAYGATMAAAFAYDQARAAAGANRLGDAVAALDLAVALDPGLALYERQRGAAELLRGEIGDSIRDFASVTRTNPSDELAWRSLALALRAGGDKAAAASALQKALAAQRSDPTNLVLLASWQRTDGDATGEVKTLGEVVQAWPQIGAAPGWQDLLSPTVSAQRVIDEAVALWVQGAPSPEPFTGQGVWLAVLANRDDLIPRAAADSGLGSSLLSATVGTFRCDGQALERAALSSADRRTLAYWLLVIRATTLSGSPDPGARNLASAWGVDLDAEKEPQLVGALNENTAPGFSTDAWGYRRPPIAWADQPVQLPSVARGAANWLLNPRASTEASGLANRLPNCH